MWLFGIKGQASQGCSAALLCALALCLYQRCTGLPVWARDEGSGQKASDFSVPLVLLLTDTGVAQTGANEGATPAPAAGPEDDNSLGYTGTAAASACSSFCWRVSNLGKVKVVLNSGKRRPLTSFSAFLSVIHAKSFIFDKKKKGLKSPYHLLYLISSLKMINLSGGQCQESLIGPFNLFKAVK